VKNSRVYRREFPFQSGTGKRKRGRKACGEESEVMVNFSLHSRLNRKQERVVGGWGEKSRGESYRGSRVEKLKGSDRQKAERAAERMR